MLANNECLENKPVSLSHESEVIFRAGQHQIQACKENKGEVWWRGMVYGNLLITFLLLITSTDHGA